MSSDYTPDQLRELLEQVRLDKGAFVRARTDIANRLADVRVREANGEVASDVTSFSGTQAVMGAIGLSIIQFDYMIQALECQLEDLEGRRDNLYALPSKGDPDEC